MKIWQGTCIVMRLSRHAGSLTQSTRTRGLDRSPPECPPQVLAMADFIGSTSAIIKWCVETDAREFIVMTESGVRFSLDRYAPEKKFYFVANENCNCSECRT